LSKVDWLLITLVDRRDVTWSFFLGESFLVSTSFGSTASSALGCAVYELAGSFSVSALPGALLGGV
jgi:hypothetical protein